MRERKMAAAVFAAVWAALCLNGCAKKDHGEELDFLSRLQQSEDWQSDLSSHFRVYLSDDREQLIGKDIYIETLQEAYNTETLERFLDRVQQGKTAEMDFLRVEFDTSYFYYLAYDGVQFYLFADGSQNHTVGEENWYYEKTYQYLYTNLREEKGYIYTDYFFSNEPQQETDGKNRTGNLFSTRDENSLENILSAYDLVGKAC